MAQESVLRIVIDSRNAERNAHALANELESIEKNGDFATKSMDSMSVATRQLAGYMAGIVTIGAAINKMDAYTGINNKLKLVTTSQTELNQAMQDTFAIAQRSASSWSAVNDVYSKYMSNAKTLNLTQAQTARLTEITSKAVALSGSSAESAAGALFQYGQALDGGILRAEEYNSIVDGAGGLLSAMAKGLNVTRGELRQMMLDGKLTGEVITKALLKAGDSVDELFNKTDVTIGQSLTVLSDSVTKFVGEASSGSGAATVLAGSIRVLADNLDLIADGAIVLGIGYITTAIATKTLAVKADIVATLGQRAATQAQAIEEVKLATAIVNDAKAHLASTQATAAATQAKFGATAAAAKYKMATDAVTQAIIRQEAAEKAAYGSTMNMSKASAGLLGFLGGPVGIGLTLATVAAGYMLMRDNAEKATAAIDIQGQSVDDLVIKYRELNTLQRDNEAKALADQVEDLSVKFRVASSDLMSFMQALPASDEKIDFFVKLTKEYQNGKIKSDAYYDAVKNVNFMTDEQLDKVRGLVGRYGEVKTKFGEAETAQKAFAASARKTTEDVKDQAVGVANLTEKMKELLRTSTQNIQDSKITTALASRGYNDTMIDLAKKYLAIEGAIVKNAQGQSVLRADLQKMLKAEYDAIMKAKGAVDSRNEAEKERTKEFEKQQKVLQVNAKVQALASKYNITAKETANNIPNGLISAMIMQESRGDTYRNGKLLTSPAGAQGVGQFMPGTAKQYGVDVRSEESGINGMIKMMSALIKQFGGDIDKAIMAYNAGPGNVQNGKAYGFKETKNYLSNVKGYMAGSSGFKEGDISSKEFDRILEESTRIAIEQAKARTQLEVEVSSEVEKIRANLQEKLDEIDAANFSPEKAKEIKAEYQARADNDIAIAQQALKTKLDDYGAFKKTESQLLEDSFNERKFYASRDLELTKEQRDKAVALLDEQLKQEQALLMLAYETRIFQYREALMAEAELVRERYRIEMLELSKIVDIEERRIAMQAKTTTFIRGNLAPVGTPVVESDKGKSNTQLLQEETGRELLAMQNRHLAAQVAAKDNADELLRIDRDYLAAKEQLHAKHDIKLVDARQADHDNQLQFYGQMLSQAGSVWGDMTQMIKDAKGENSKTFKAMFLAQQSMAIAQQIINTELAAGATTAQTGIFGLPAAAVIRGIGYASVGLIAAQTIAGFETGGYTGSGGRKDVAGVVHGQEYVLNAAATKRVGVGTLDAINSGKSMGGGGGDVYYTQTIHIASDGSATSESDAKQLGKMMENMTLSVIRREQRQGGLLSR